MKLLLLFVSILLMGSTCLGCRRSFDTPKGLKIHRCSCEAFTSTTRSLLLKRTWPQERYESYDAAKIARRLNDMEDVRCESATGEGSASIDQIRSMVGVNADINDQVRTSLYDFFYHIVIVIPTFRV